MAEAKRLFGPTVEELNAQLKADQSAFMERAAQLGPDYAAGAGVGSLLGGVVSKMFGIENPQLKKARTLEEIQKKIRADNPGLTDKGAYYDIAASYLAEIPGFENEVMQAQEMANEYRLSEEGRALDTEFKQAQIGKLRAEAEAELLPKAYKPASGVGQLYADLDYATSTGNTAAVASIKKKIAEEEKGKEVTPQNKIDNLILEGLIKQTGGDEIKAANLFEDAKFNKELRKAAAGAGNSLDKALTVLLETNKAKEKETAIRALDTKSYKDDLAARLSETYTGLEGNEEANVLSMTTDHTNAKKHAIRLGLSYEEAEAYADARIEAGIQEVKGAYYGTNKVYKKAPLAKIDGASAALQTPAKDKAKGELPAGSRAGQKVMSGPNAGKYEVLDTSGKLIGYADQGTK
jgi:hypothetical protein